MASATLSAVAGAILFPTLPQIALDKLINYLSKDQPSSSGEASNKLQQLQNEEALKDANQKLKIMQSEAKMLLKKDKQNLRVIYSLKKLNDVGYQIQDLESDLEYMELQRKVEEEINQAEADTSQSRGRKRWFSFLWAKGQSSEKRLRLSSSESLKLPLDDMVKRISSLIKQINSMYSDMNGLSKGISSNEIYDPKNHLMENKRVTTSSTNETKIYCRDHQTKNLIKVLLERPNVNGNISVVPILGMGGIGKTTLAQFAFNNPEIENYFDKKVWVFVSNHFDRFRITKEIVESLSTDASSKFPYGTTNLDSLEAELKSRLTGNKKFLLVLDDVWSYEWQQLLAPLKFTKSKSIKIIVTSRDPTVLAGLETGDGFPLEGLYGDEYRAFFIDCVFGNENRDKYSSALQSIGEQIMKKLKGSPLAVKTVGRLLGRNLTEEHWKHVLDSDLWKIGSDANDIMPALALSYHHLLEHLQMCFAFCSVLPKGYEINKYELIGMWIAHGYILENGTNSKTLEDIGDEYVEELKQLSLIEVGVWDLCKMHDLLHDLAESVSQGEVCYYEGKKGKRISRNVRHLCVCGPVDPESVQLSSSLRTLVLYGDDICSQVELEALNRIRVLIVIDKNMQEFPEAVTHLKHLRYLDFSRSSINCVPESLCRLYQLRVLRLPPLDALPSLFHSLINLRFFMFCHRFYLGVWYLQANRYEVRREGGYKIAQLRNMNELTGRLEIKGLENIENREEAKKANLKEKGLIKYLKLCWEDSSVGAGCTDVVQEEVFEGLQPHHNLKHLEIHSYMGSKSPSWLGTTPVALQMLTRIELEKCKNWSRLPSSIGLLPFLEYLKLEEMGNIRIEGDGRKTEIFPSLKNLQLMNLTSVSFEGMSLSSSSTSTSSSSSSTTQPGGRNWFHLQQRSQVMATLEPLHDVRVEQQGVFRVFLPKLTELNIEHCHNLESLLACLPFLPSLTSLKISFCRKLRRLWVEEGTLEQQQGVKVLLPKLTELNIEYCKDLESLPACLPLLPSLECLKIWDCPKVHSLPEGGLPSSLRRLVIHDTGLMECCRQELSKPEWEMIASLFTYIWIRKYKERNEEAG
ncbi:hypothetical protein J5N97_018355 [Dioscorea zingiberensis]|uniref:NB-ARC domain-containing protein n=1 Tax=Dioscorea zingiberensis TaxID=325984 RepID=A0A9D5CQE0_9LILI|nr:hypothetical protein J5N97_018355 [Dioscorea zingiberensis]